MREHICSYSHTVKIQKLHKYIIAGAGGGSYVLYELRKTVRGEK